MAISEDLRSVQATLMQGHRCCVWHAATCNPSRNRSNPLRTSLWQRGISPEKPDAAGGNDAPSVRCNADGALFAIAVNDSQ